MPDLIAQGVEAQQRWRRTLSEGESIVLGRLGGVWAVPWDHQVSRRHASLERVGDSYQILIHPDATNRLLFQGKPVTERHRLHDGDEISVESSVPDLSVKLYYRSGIPSPAAVAPPRPVELKAQPSDKTMLDADFNLEELSTPPELVITVAGSLPQTYSLIRDKLTLGRAEDNDIVIPSRIVSRHHARIHVSAEGIEVEDLGSKNGTLLNGTAVSEAKLADGTPVAVEEEACPCPAGISWWWHCSPCLRYS